MTERPRGGRLWTVVFGFGCVVLLTTTCLLAFLNRTEAERLRDRVGKMEERSVRADEAEYRYEQILQERTQEKLEKVANAKRAAELGATVERLEGELLRLRTDLEAVRAEREEYFAELTVLRRRCRDAESCLAGLLDAEGRAAELEAENRGLRRRLADAARRAREILARLAEVRAELGE